MNNIIKNTQTQLAAWPGYSILQDIMNAYPDVPCYLAGGVIRDIILGRISRPKDFDFFLGGDNFNAFVNSLEIHGQVIEGPFGSPRWFFGDKKEKYADIIPIKTFYNGLWHCDNIIDALNQFDFTANAIAFDVREETLYDPQNGIRDLSQRMMKMIRFDYPDEPIRENISITRTTVLWFRILHYAKLLNLDIEPITFNWLCAKIDCQKDIDMFIKYFFKPCDSFLEPIQKCRNLS